MAMDASHWDPGGRCSGVSLDAPLLEGLLSPGSVSQDSEMQKWACFQVCAENTPEI